MNEHGVSIEYWAARFWKLAGGRGGFPTNIEYAAMSALEVRIEKVGNLTVSKAASGFGRAKALSSELTSERRLRGCVLVSGNGATILVEANDDEAQRRFTVAHETAHLILEVKRRHERMESRLGRGFDDILYGHREATNDERIEAWLRGVRLDPILHLMDRDPDGTRECGRTNQTECAADDLALEILAPRSEMADSIFASGSSRFAETLEAASEIAERRFGLPKYIAEMYASRLVWQMKGGPSSAERFGFAR